MQMQTRKFIISKVENTWVQELKDACAYYTNVTTMALLTHLQHMCLSAHDINSIKLTMVMWN